MLHLSAQVIVRMFYVLLLYPYTYSMQELLDAHVQGVGKALLEMLPQIKCVSPRHVLMDQKQCKIVFNSDDATT